MISKQYDTRNRMSTIASPRPSVSLSSRRGSASSSTTITSNTASGKASVVERGSLRRNRAALRDYYNLKPPDSPATSDAPTGPTLDVEQESELDKPGFKPEPYVRELLAREGLEGVLRVAAGLVGDIRSLDGEKKALVYDNYSKLIAATDTIKSMREKMDPLTPTTSTLTPAIGHIAETASSLAADLPTGESASARLKEADQNTQKALVRWVLQAPARIQRLADEGKIDAAQDDWTRVQACLDKWKDVKGSEDIRRQCLEIMETLPTG